MTKLKEKSSQSSAKVQSEKKYKLIVTESFGSYKPGNFIFNQEEIDQALASHRSKVNLVLIKS